MKNNIVRTRKIQSELKLDKLPEAPLMPFDGSSHTDVNVALLFTKEDYFELVDTTGRIVREDKRGFIPAEVPAIIKRLGLKSDRWLDHVKNFSRRYGACAGCVARMESYSESKGRKWSKGMGVAKRMVFI